MPLFFMIGSFCLYNVLCRVKTFIKAFRLSQNIADKPTIRHIEEEILDRLGSWIYFDGAAQGDPQFCGERG